MASIPQQATYGVYHLISDFLAERLKAYKNWQKRSLILQYKNLLENSWKFNSRVGVEEILFDMFKSNAKKLKCFGLLSLFKTTNFCTKCILLDINVE